MVPLLDFDLDDGPCLVYEHLKCASVARLIEKHSRLAPAAALRIARGMTHTVAELHRLGILLGSLEPRHVLLDTQGKTRLAEAGWSLLDPSFPGDPSSQVDRSKDLQQVARLLYTMLTGNPPLEGLWSLSSFLDGVPPVLEQSIQRLLQNAQALATPEDLLAELGPLLEHEEVGRRKDIYPNKGDGQVQAGPAAVSLDEPTFEGTRDRISGGTPIEAAPVESSAASPVANSPAHGGRRRSDVLRAVGEVGRTKPKAKKIGSLVVNVGKKEGPTYLNLFGAILLAGGSLGGLGYFILEQGKAEHENPDHIRVRGVKGKVKNSQIDKFGKVEIDDSNARGLVAAIREEPRLPERMKLVSRLVDKFPSQAPEELASLLKGSSQQLRATIFPIFEPLDRDGKHRLELLRFALPKDEEWTRRLAVSLVKSGREGELLTQASKVRSEPALLAIAAGMKNVERVTPEFAARFEVAYLEADGDSREKYLKDWIQVSGGSEGRMAHWLLAEHLKRMPDPEDRSLILQVALNLQPNPKLFEILFAQGQQILLGFSDYSDQELYFEVLEKLSGGEHTQRIEELRRSS